MKYDLNNFEKKESDIMILKEITKNQGFSGKVIGDVSEFIAERIEIMDKYSPFYSVLETEIRRPRNFASCLIKKNSEEILVSYKNLGKNFLDLAGKLNDEKLAEQAKQCFSSVVECYKILINNLDKQNKEKKGEYKDLSEKYEFLSNNTFKLKEVLNIYFKKRKNTENLINSAYKSFFSLSKSEDHILDELNMLDEHLDNTNNINYVKLMGSIIKIQKHARYLELDSNKINQTIKKILVTKLTSQQKNRLENLL